MVRGVGARVAVLGACALWAVVGCRGDSPSDSSSKRPTLSIGESAKTGEKSPQGSLTEAEKATRSVRVRPGVAVDSATRLGKPAPDFSLQDTDGNTFRLSDHLGSVVVLEWFNPDCAFAAHAHADGVLGDLSSKSIGDGVLWLAINSTAVGKEGSGRDRNARARIDLGMKGPVLLDEDGKVGRLYKAKTTPHIFVIDSAGKLAYRGAPDNAPMGRVPRTGTVNRYLADALTEVKAGRAALRARTNPYGCSVKY